MSPGSVPAPRGSRAFMALVLLACATPVFAQQPLAYHRGREAAILAEFAEFLAIPNVAADRVNIRRNADHLAELMRKRGLEPRFLASTDSTAPPALYAEWRVPGAVRTLAFYAHYDGQPVDPADWTDHAPWTPVLRTARLDLGGRVIPFPTSGGIDPESRIYARSASDDKVGVMALLNAVSALRAARRTPTVNVKLFFDGEEEAGSPHLAEILSANAELLRSDGWIFVDGPVHASGRKQLAFGSRGDVNVTVTVFGPKRPLHSGHYGNWVPNPAQELARLLASLKDEDGKVLVAGWYDDVTPLTAEELAAVRAAPLVDDSLRRDLGIARPEGAGATLAERINLPSLNINGIRAADVGAQARNVIPTIATATLDLRVVEGVDYRKQIDRLREHMRTQGFLVLDREPTDAERLSNSRIARVTPSTSGNNSSRVPMALPLSQAVIRALQSVESGNVVLTPTLGGTLPTIELREVLGVHTLILPLANPDNNQHAEDENLRLQNFWDGIEMVAAVMRLKAW
jgi:acetylornithine deacetylase/succinyl-diaminopimelate desuccinylase-like protein